MKLKTCPKCKEYTTKDICPKCKEKTKDSHYKQIKIHPSLKKENSE
jgi:rRNA maturation protein Nop10